MKCKLSWLESASTRLLYNSTKSIGMLVPPRYDLVISYSYISVLYSIYSQIKHIAKKWPVSAQHTTTSSQKNNIIVHYRIAIDSLECLSVNPSNFLAFKGLGLCEDVFDPAANAVETRDLKDGNKVDLQCPSVFFTFTSKSVPNAWWRNLTCLRRPLLRACFLTSI